MSESLQLFTIRRQINTDNYQLSGIQQNRLDAKEELTEILNAYGQDSPQYKEAMAQAATLDAELEQEQNVLQLDIQQLTAWAESLQEGIEKSNERIFGA
ncbi:hypothetical protein IJ732_06305 [bacterium]|nr:hypothetical protein [bacterium]